MEKENEHYTAEETEQRLRKTLKAAFNMKPTPLKNVPKRDGQVRGSSASAPRLKQK